MKRKNAKIMYSIIYLSDSGVEKSGLSCQAHNLEIVGSNPASATI